MTDFRVSEIVDGDTFAVENGWQWNGQTGERVRPTGYNAPELGKPGGAQAKSRLSNLILGKKVHIPRAHRVDRGRLVADVYYKGRNLASYFPKYRT